MFNYRKNIENPNLQYEYYKVISWAWYDLKDNCSFGSIPYDKVMDKLKSIDISFVVVSKNEEIIKYNGDNMVYDSYYKLAKKAYDKYEKKNELIDKVKIICEDNDSYNELNGYVDKIMERIA